MPYPEGLEREARREARRQQIQEIRAAQQQAQSAAGSAVNPANYRTGHYSAAVCLSATYADLPIVHEDDFDFLEDVGQEPYSLGGKPPYFDDFQLACRQGVLPTVQAIVSQEICTPAFLHHGLTLALRAGNATVCDFLLSKGAPIVRETARNVLSAPPDLQVPLFDVLALHGWTPGHDLFMSVIPNTVLLRWFLAHGVDPNYGIRPDAPDRAGGPDSHFCAALELAAGVGSVEAVQILLEAGARPEYGVPLHRAAGACPPGFNPLAGRVTMSEEFDKSRIPVMAILVDHGADVNKKETSPYQTAQYAVVHAVMVGAVARVKWLSEHGANLDAKGCFGSAADYARTTSSDEMKSVVENVDKMRIPSSS